VDLSNRSTFSHERATSSADSSDARGLLVVSVEGGRLSVPAPASRDRPTSEPPRPAPRRAPRIADPELGKVVAEACAYYGVDDELVACLIEQESGFRRHAVSPKGAAGYMQLMPGTARRMGVVDVFDTRQNVWGGVRYLRYLLDLFRGDLSLALAGYNAGEGRVVRAGYRVPHIAETMKYVRAIVARYGDTMHREPAGRETPGSEPGGRP
jgi:soluble lytic murein transglycosylase-like protein